MPDAQLIGILEGDWQAGGWQAVFRRVVGGRFEADRSPDETLTSRNRVTKNERHRGGWVGGLRLCSGVQALVNP